MADPGSGDELDIAVDLIRGCLESTTSFSSPASSSSVEVVEENLLIDLFEGLNRACDNRLQILHLIEPLVIILDGLPPQGEQDASRIKFISTTILKCFSLAPNEELAKAGMRFFLACMSRPRGDAALLRDLVWGLEVLLLEKEFDPASHVAVGLPQNIKPALKGLRIQGETLNSIVREALTVPPASATHSSGSVKNNPIYTSLQRQLRVYFHINCARLCLEFCQREYKLVLEKLTVQPLVGLGGEEDDTKDVLIPRLGHSFEPTDLTLTMQQLSIMSYQYHCELDANVIRMNTVTSLLWLVCTSISDKEEDCIDSEFGDWISKILRNMLDVHRKHLQLYKNLQTKYPCFMTPYWAPKCRKSLLAYIISPKLILHLARHTTMSTHSVIVSLLNEYLLEWIIVANNHGRHVPTDLTTLNTALELLAVVLKDDAVAQQLRPSSSDLDWVGSLVEIYSLLQPTRPTPYLGFCSPWISVCLRNTAHVLSLIFSSSVLYKIYESCISLATLDKLYSCCAVDESDLKEDEPLVAALSSGFLGNEKEWHLLEKILEPSGHLDGKSFPLFISHPLLVLLLSMQAGRQTNERVVGRQGAEDSVFVLVCRGLLNELARADQWLTKLASSRRLADEVHDEVLMKKEDAEEEDSEHSNTPPAVVRTTTSPVVTEDQQMIWFDSGSGFTVYLKVNDLVTGSLPSLLRKGFVELIFSVFKACGHSTRVGLFHGVVEMIRCCDAHLGQFNNMPALLKRAVLLAEYLLRGWIFDSPPKEGYGALCGIVNFGKDRFVEGISNMATSCPSLNLILPKRQAPVGDLKSLAQVLLHVTGSFFRSVVEDDHKIFIEDERFEHDQMQYACLRVLSMICAFDDSLMEIEGSEDVVGPNMGQVVADLHVSLAKFKDAPRSVEISALLSGIFSQAPLLSHFPPLEGHRKDECLVLDAARSDLLARSAFTVLRLCRGVEDSAVVELVGGFIHRWLNHWFLTLQETFMSFCSLQFQLADDSFKSLVEMLFSSFAASVSDRVFQDALSEMCQITQTRVSDIVNDSLTFLGTSQDAIIGTPWSVKADSVDWDQSFASLYIESTCRICNVDLLEISSAKTALVSIERSILHLLDVSRLFFILTQSTSPVNDDLEFVISQFQFRSCSPAVKSLARVMKGASLPTIPARRSRLDFYCRILTMIQSLLKNPTCASKILRNGNSSAKVLCPVVSDIFLKIDPCLSVLAYNTSPAKKHLVGKLLRSISSVVCESSLSSISARKGLNIMSRLLDQVKPEDAEELLLLDEVFYQNIVCTILAQSKPQLSLYSSLLGRLLSLDAKTTSKRGMNSIMTIAPSLFLQKRAGFIDLIKIFAQVADENVLLPIITSVVEEAVSHTIGTSSNEDVVTCLQIIETCMNTVKSLVGKNGLPKETTARTTTTTASSNNGNTARYSEDGLLDVLDMDSDDGNVLLHDRVGYQEKMLIDDDEDADDDDDDELSRTRREEEEDDDDEDDEMDDDDDDDEEEDNMDEDGQDGDMLVEDDDFIVHGDEDEEEDEDEDDFVEEDDDDDDVVVEDIGGKPDEIDDVDGMFVDGSKIIGEQKSKPSSGWMVDRLNRSTGKLDSTRNNTEAKNNRKNKKKKTPKPKICTFTVTGDQYEEQHWYHCLTCNLTREKGCCSVCARFCHAGHVITYARRSRFFCDCGAGSSCKSKKPRTKAITDPRGFEEAAPESSTTVLNASSSGATNKSMSSTRKVNKLKKKGNNGVNQATKNAVDVMKMFEFSSCASSVFLWLMKQHKEVMDAQFPVAAQREFFTKESATVEGAFQLKRLFSGGGIVGDKKWRPHYKVLAVNSLGHLFIAEGTTIRCIHAGALLCSGARNSQGAKYSSSASRVSDSSMIPLYRMSLSFVVRQIEFNPLRDSFVAIVGDTNCFVLTLSEKGSVVSKLRIELALGVGKNEMDIRSSSDCIVGVEWLNGSQTHLMVVSSSWIKIYDLSVDNTYPSSYCELEANIVNFCTTSLIRHDRRCTLVLLLLRSGTILRQEIDTRKRIDTFLGSSVVELPPSIKGTILSMHLPSPVHSTSPMLLLSYTNGNCYSVKFDEEFTCYAGFEFLEKKNTSIADDKQRGSANGDSKSSIHNSTSATKSNTTHEIVHWLDWCEPKDQQLSIGFDRHGNFILTGWDGESRQHKVVRTESLSLSNTPTNGSSAGLSRLGRNGKQLNIVGVCPWPPPWTSRPCYQNYELDFLMSYFSRTPQPSAVLAQIAGAQQQQDFSRMFPFVGLDNKVLLVLTDNGQLHKLSPSLTKAYLDKQLDYIRENKSKAFMPSGCGRVNAVPSSFFFEHVIPVSSNGLLSSCFSWGGSVLKSTGTAQRASTVLQVSRDDSNVSSKSPYEDFVVSAHLTCPNHALVALRVLVGGNYSSSSTASSRNMPKAVTVGPLCRRIQLTFTKGSRWLDLALTPLEAMLSLASGSVFISLTPASTGPGDNLVIDAIEAYAMRTDSSLWYDFVSPAWRFCRSLLLKREENKKKNRTTITSDTDRAGMVANINSALSSTLDCLEAFVEVAGSDTGESKDPALLELLETCVARKKIMEACSPLAGTLLENSSPQSRLLEFIHRNSGVPLENRVARLCFQEIRKEVLSKVSLGMDNTLSLICCLELVREQKPVIYLEWAGKDLNGKVEDLLVGLASLIKDEITMKRRATITSSASLSIGHDDVFLFQKALVMYIQEVIQSCFVLWKEQNTPKHSESIMGVVKKCLEMLLNDAEPMLCVFAAQGFYQSIFPFISVPPTPPSSKDEDKDSSKSTAKKKETKKKSNELNVGQSIQYCCDSCKTMPLVGVRWHCSVCEDYDLCSKCKGKSYGKHAASHVMIPIMPSSALNVEKAEVKNEFGMLLIKELGRLATDVNVDKLVKATIVRGLIELCKPEGAKLGVNETATTFSRSIIEHLKDIDTKEKLEAMLLQDQSPLGVAMLLHTTALRSIFVASSTSTATDKTTSSTRVFSTEKLHSMIGDTKKDLASELLRVLLLLLELPKTRFDDTQTAMTDNTSTIVGASGTSLKALKPNAKNPTGSAYGLWLSSSVVCWDPFVKSSTTIQSKGEPELLFSSNALPRGLLRGFCYLLQFSVSDTTFGKSSGELEAIVDKLMVLVQEPHFRFVSKRANDILLTACSLSPHAIDYRWRKNNDLFAKWLEGIRAIQSRGTNGSSRSLDQELAIMGSLSVMPSYLPKSLTYEDISDLTRKVKSLLQSMVDEPTYWTRYCAADAGTSALLTLFRSLGLLAEQGVVHCFRVLLQAFPNMSRRNKEMLHDERELAQNMATLIRDNPGDTIVTLVEMFLVKNDNPSVRLYAATTWRRIWALLSNCTNSGTVREASTTMLVHLACVFTRVLRSCEYPSELIMLMGKVLEDGVGSLDGKLVQGDALFKPMMRHLTDVMRWSLLAVEQDTEVIKNRQMAKFVNITASSGHKASEGASSGKNPQFVLPALGIGIDSCLSCKVPRRNFKSMQLKHVRKEQKFSSNMMLVSLDCLLTINGIRCNTSTHSNVFGCGVSSVSVYCNSSPSLELEIPSRKANTTPSRDWSNWHKIGTLKMSREKDFRVSIKLDIPVSVCNLLFEYETTPELVFSQNSERQICPRCNRTVVDRSGVCQCGEVVFQCRQCRRINQEDRNAFLCVECGYCRFAKFFYILDARISCDYTPILTEMDKENALKRFASFEETAHSLVVNLQQNSSRSDQGDLVGLWKIQGLNAVSKPLLIEDLPAGKVTGSSSSSKAPALSGSGVSTSTKKRPVMVSMEPKAGSLDFLQKLGFVQDIRAIQRIAENKRQKGREKRSSGKKSSSDSTAGAMNASSKTTGFFQGLLLGINDMDAAERSISENPRQVDSVRPPSSSSSSSTALRLGKSSRRKRKLPGSSSSSSSERSRYSILKDAPAVKSTVLNPTVSTLLKQLPSSASMYDKLIRTRKAMGNIHKQFVMYSNRSSVGLEASTEHSREMSDGSSDFVKKCLEELSRSVSVVDNNGRQAKCVTCSEEIFLLCCNLVKAAADVESTRSLLLPGNEESEVVRVLFLRGISLIGTDERLDPVGEALLSIACSSDHATKQVLKVMKEKLLYVIKTGESLHAGEWTSGIRVLLSKMCSGKCMEVARRFLINFLSEIVHNEGMFIDKTEVVVAIVAPMLRIVLNVSTTNGIESSWSEDFSVCFTFYNATGVFPWHTRSEREAALIVQRFLKKKRGKSVTSTLSFASSSAVEKARLDWTWLIKLLVDGKSVTVRKLASSIICKLVREHSKPGLVPGSALSRHKSSTAKNSPPPPSPASKRQYLVLDGLIKVLASLYREQAGLQFTGTADSSAVFLVIKLIEDISSLDSSMINFLHVRGYFKLLAKILQHESIRLCNLEEAVCRRQLTQWMPMSEERHFVWFLAVAKGLNKIGTVQTTRRLTEFILEAQVRAVSLVMFHGASVAECAKNLLPELLKSVEQDTLWAGGELLGRFAEELDSAVKKKSSIGKLTVLNRVQKLLDHVINVISPRKILPNINILMQRARSQEEYFSGSLENNPISIDDVPIEEAESNDNASVAGGGQSNSSEVNSVPSPGASRRSFSEPNPHADKSDTTQRRREPTMRDLRSKIANDLNFRHAKDIMELLVGGKLINLDLPIRLVYEKVWKAQREESGGNNSNSGVSRLGGAIARIHRIAAVGDGGQLVYSEDLDDDEMEEDKNDSCLPFDPSDAELLPDGNIHVVRRKHTLFADQLSEMDDDCVFVDPYDEMDEDGGAVFFHRGNLARIIREGKTSSSSSAGKDALMEVTYRLCGIDGEATEDFVETLTGDDDEKQDIDPELKYADTVAFAHENGIGLSALLQVLQLLTKNFSFDSGEVQQLLASAVKLVEFCSNVAVNRQSLQKLGAVSALLDALLVAFQVVSAAPVAEKIVLLLGNLVDRSDDSDDGSAQVQVNITSDDDDVSGQDDGAELNAFLTQLDAADGALRDSPRLQRALSGLLPFLTYGKRSLMLVLLERFERHLGPEKLCELDDKGGVDHFHNDSVLWAIDGMRGDKNSMAFRSAAFEFGFTSGVCKYFVDSWKRLFSKCNTIAANTAATSSSSSATTSAKVKKKGLRKRALKQFARLKSTITVLRMLTGLCKGHAATQEYLFHKDSKLLNLVFDLEQIPAEQVPLVGEYSANLLSACVESNETTKKILDNLRKTKNEEKLKRAMAKRTAIMANIGLSSETPGKEPKKRRKKKGVTAGSSSSKKQKTSNQSQPSWMKEMQALKDEEGLVCSVCQEGYTYKPNEVMGVYVFSKSISIDALVPFINRNMSISLPLQKLPGLGRKEAPAVLVNGLFDAQLKETLPNIYSACRTLFTSALPKKETTTAPPTTSSSGHFAPFGGGSSSSGSRRRAFGMTTVSCFNAIHFSCHNAAVKADKHHPKAPKDEWSGSELRNAQIKCNNLLPLRGTSVNEIPYAQAVEKYFDVQVGRNRGMSMSSASSSSPNTFSSIMLDLRVLLLRFAHGEVLSQDTGGGGRESNFKLVVPMLALMNHLVRHGVITQHSMLDAILDDFLLRATVVAHAKANPNEKVVAPTATTKRGSKKQKVSQQQQKQDPPGNDVVPSLVSIPDVCVNLVIALFHMNYHTWQVTRTAFLQGILDFSKNTEKNTKVGELPNSGAIKPVKMGGNSSSSSSSSSPLSKLALYKPGLIFYGIVNELHEAAHKAEQDNTQAVSASQGKSFNASSSVVSVLLKEEYKAIQTMEAICLKYENSFLKCETLSQLLIAVGVVDATEQEFFLAQV